MTNGEELFNTATKVLTGEESPNKVTNDLLAAMLKGIYLDLQQQFKDNKERDRRIDKLEHERIEKLERKSIVLWMETHPKLAPTVLTLFVLGVMFLHELSPSIIAGLGLLLGIK